MKKRILILLSLFIIISILLIKYTGIYNLKESIGNNQHISQIGDLWNTYKENEVLQDRIDSYEQLKVDKDLIISDNKLLSDIKTVVNKYKKYNPVVGTVISRDLDPKNQQLWYNFLVINKGKVDSIKENMAVLGPDGLIGLIHKVNENSSEVQLLTSSGRKNLIPATLEKDESVFGMIENYDMESNQLNFTRLDPSVKIEVGNIVTTSKQSKTFPIPLKIGEVVEVKHDNFGLTNTALVKPAADFYNISYVVILQEEN
ncbi:rod shape-determining protein MreC [Metabacillus crassostreae]|uniref:rod shape-determining protein MreC n=1 Tax=Metabacillus crassostreae TaxID=929098 RepID=UPI00195799B0|nr:rod shape-determining protein MreC [Metabacillus crassostreae]MBM7602456.1 rod shape-determining protein MreC [Metabacillus crassostreae]